MKALGKLWWAIPGGHIPLASSGEEPLWTSRDTLCILNTGEADAEIDLTIVYSEREPVGPYKLNVPSQRVRHFRVNDLIDPLAVPLDEPYAAVLEANVPIVVQFTRVDTGHPQQAICSTMAFSD